MKTKKVLFCLILVLTTALSLSACTERTESSVTPMETPDADPLPPGEKIELNLTVFYADFANLNDLVEAFNRSSDRYHVAVRDLFGEASLYAGITAPELQAQSLKRLNTEIMAGDCPDMLCFDGPSPLPFIRKGLLVDMEELFARDTDLCLEDLAIEPALQSQNGIYYISPTFSVYTCVGLYSNFGDSYGWTLADYLAMEKVRPSGTGMFSGVSRQEFLFHISALYALSAVDWENGTCNFENSDFISILETAGRIREESMSLELKEDGYHVGTGQVALEFNTLHKVWNFADFEKNAGAKLSCIGYPTVDGSCGSMIYMSNPVGIFSNSEHIDGCWEFIKFMIMNTGADKIDEGLHYAMPVYLPSLQAMAEAEKTHIPVETTGYDFLNEDRESPIQMTDEDVRRFFELMQHFDKLYLYSESDTIMKIISDAGDSYFQGAISAQDAAAKVQEKVSLYLAELG